MKWTIAICTTPARCKSLEKLTKRLLPQVDKYQGEIEVLVFFNNYEYSLGFLRQCLLDEARGEYISHVDDDDMVPKDYCDTIYPLLDGVDYIGFEVDFYDHGKKMKPVYHSLQYANWSQDDRGYYRGVTHLNPVRTELARESSFPIEYMVGEDEQWANRVQAKTEHVINKPMYTYLHMGHESITRQSDTPIRPVFKSINIRFHPRSTQNAY